jgi:hypothetical protein
MIVGSSYDKKREKSKKTRGNNLKGLVGGKYLLKRGERETVDERQRGIYL